ncbi:MAG: hypothetical protein HY319_05500 [Armatimonadetes bacterium]|nr:hypothetical protein [Armatimonadota bacterium]
MVESAGGLRARIERARTAEEVARIALDAGPVSEREPLVLERFAADPRTAEAASLCRKVLEVVEPSSRPPVLKALLYQPLASGVSQLAQLGTAFLDAVPPSITSHIERGKASRALLGALVGQPHVGAALQVALQAVERAVMYTSWTDIARSALAVPEANRAEDLAALGVRILDEIPPAYAMDAGIAGRAILEAILERESDPKARALVSEALEKIGTEPEHPIKEAVAQATFEQLLHWAEDRRQTNELASALVRKENPTIRVQKNFVEVGGVRVPIRRAGQD